MKVISSVFTWSIVVLLISCHPKTAEKAVKTPVETEVKEVVSVEETSRETESLEKDTIPSELPIYRAAETRIADLLHTRLNLSFDWEKQHVLGEAYINFSPVFYTMDALDLHAVNFDIHAVKIGDKNGESLDYEYDGHHLNITLPSPLEKGEEARVYIDYTAKPNEGEAGGSQAITSEKGLYFILPNDSDPEFKGQIWTQGETESNSRWFPTFDKPNERMTQELYLTVDKGFETLSNGLLVSSTENADGSRTDYWKMSKPHAPYLFMLTIGDFHIDSESWNGIPVEYYVEHDYAESAKEIFDHTPEMLSFFSHLVDYPYPWEKYSQVVVKEYVSGAMENTTAVIFGDFVQKHKEELELAPNDFIVAHEMFHHWFGDLVTTESWSNLTLNEGFANYAEYLWAEHHEGIYEAEDHRFGQLSGYLNQAQSVRHPLVDFKYDSEMDMFDAHSYNKGGLVLHYLRNIVGDEAFFASLSKYLKDNEYSAVEVDELRLAFEDVTGRDLNWFFDQWFLSPGHPEMEVSRSYSAEEGTVTVTVEQVQDPENNVPIFQLPLEIAIWNSHGEVETRHAFVNSRTENITLPVEEEPTLVLIDPKRLILGTMNVDYSDEDWEKILLYVDEYKYRVEALDKSADSEDAAVQTALREMLNSDSDLLRVKVLQAMPYSANKVEIVRIAQEDDSPQMRMKALDILEKNGHESALQIANNKYAESGNKTERNNALKVINSLDNAKAVTLVERDLLSDDSNSSILLSAEVLSTSGDEKYLNFFRENIANVSGYYTIPFMTLYGQLLGELSAETKKEEIDFISDHALENSGNMFKGFGSAYMLFNLKNTLNAEENAESIEKIGTTIRKIYDEMPEGQLKSVVANFL